MEQTNKPSAFVTMLMWLQIVQLGLALLFFLVLIALGVIAANGAEVAAIAAIIAFTALGIFTARSILRGYSWAWWLELIYTVPTVSIAIQNISQFKGFSPVADPEMFIRKTVGEALQLAMAPVLLATPFICITMAIQWRRRELAAKGTSETEQT